LFRYEGSVTVVYPNKPQTPQPEVRQQLDTTEWKIAGLTESSHFHSIIYHKIL